MLPLCRVYGMSGGVERQAPVQELQLLQGLGRIPVDTRHHVQLRHLRRGPLLRRQAQGKYFFMCVKYFLVTLVFAVQLLWTARHSPGTEIQLLL